MTAELVLLLSIYATIILGLFYDSKYGVVKTFHSNLPLLSARLERNVSTGSGFYIGERGGVSEGYRWKEGL